MPSIPILGHGACLHVFISLCPSTHLFWFYSLRTCIFLAKYISRYFRGLLKFLSGEESACNTGDVGSIPVLECSPVEGNGNPLQYSCLKNSMDRGTWWATVYEVTKKDNNKNRYLRIFVIMKEIF